MIENEKRFTVRNLTKSFGCGYSGINGELIKELAEDGETVLDLELEIWDNGKAMTFETCCSTLNQLWEENQQVKKVLQKYFDKYTRRAIEGHPYDDVTEAISDIADELGVELE